jgi:hypothetical protein
MNTTNLKINPSWCCIIMNCNGQVYSRSAVSNAFKNNQKRFEITLKGIFILFGPGIPLEVARVFFFFGGGGSKERSLHLQNAELAQALSGDNIPNRRLPVLPTRYARTLSQ